MIVVQLILLIRMNYFLCSNKLLLYISIYTYLYLECIYDIKTYVIKLYLDFVG